MTTHALDSLKALLGRAITSFECLFDARLCRPPVHGVSPTENSPGTYTHFVVHGQTAGTT